MNQIRNSDKNPFRKSSSPQPTNRVENRLAKPTTLPARWNTVTAQKATLQPESSTIQNNYQPFPHFDSSQSASFVGSSSNNDLRTSSSQDSRRSQNEAVFENDIKPEPAVQKQKPKAPAIEYQPPFLHPIFNANNYSSGITAKAPTNKFLPSPTKFVPISSTTTTIPPSTSDKINFSQVTTTTANSIDGQANIDRTRVRPSSQSSSVVSFGEKLKTTTTTKPSNGSETLVPVLNDASKYPQPQSILLPPFETLNSYADVTTQGPPIYYEWKLPASLLEPPFDENKSNGAITIGNQVPVIPPQSTNSSKTSSTAAIPPIDKGLVPPLFDRTTKPLVKLPSLSLQPPILSASSSIVSNSFVSAPSNFSFPSLNAISQSDSSISKNSIDKLQTPRSVTTSRTTINSITTKRQSDATTKVDPNYVVLKKQFSVPNYTFPLENVQRPGYTDNNAFNSFQIKIPDNLNRDSNKIGSSSKPWYGENAKCPECHPSFLKPGSCEPCIKIR